MTLAALAIAPGIGTIALALYAVAMGGLVLWTLWQVTSAHRRIDALGERQDETVDTVKDFVAWVDEVVAWAKEPSHDAQDEPAEPDGHTDTPQDAPDAHRGAQPVDRVSVALPPVPPTQAIPRTDPGTPAVPGTEPQPEHVEPHPTQPALEKRRTGATRARGVYREGPGGVWGYQSPEDRQ